MLKVLKREKQRIFESIKESDISYEAIEKLLLYYTKHVIDTKDEVGKEFVDILGKSLLEMQKPFDTLFDDLDLYIFYPEESTHLGCPSYPMCDESPNGCIKVNGISGVEWYGHRD